MNEITHRARAEVLAGLSSTPKALSPKFFYDALGSKLFEAITFTPEYYPTSCELEVLRDRAGEIAEVLGDDVVLVELGSGQSTKVPLLLDAMSSVRAYVPVDIDAHTLELAASRLARGFPGLHVVPIAADFTHPWDLPPLVRGRRTVVFYPGSTIGNLDPDHAEEFLHGVGRMLRPGDGLLIGYDLEKDRRVLEAAYDDAAGVTAAFNLNMLAHLNRAHGSDFDPRAFRHVAFWNAELHRIEMHLESRVAQDVHLDDHTFHFDAGERIHTESSYKYTRERFVDLASRAGFGEGRHWTDAKGWFAVAWFTWHGGATPGR